MLLAVEGYATCLLGNNLVVDQFQVSDFRLWTRLLGPCADIRRNDECQNGWL